jgi:hypothetical protein
MRYYLYTTVDITETGLYWGDDSLQKNQQQNFDTILQTIGLCGNLYYDNPPTLIQSAKFPNNKTWYFEWRMEIDDLFKRGSDHIAILKDIFEYVPIITNLTETAKFDKPMITVGKNIIFDYEKPVGLKILNR